MKDTEAKKLATEMLTLADIEIDGVRPWDIKVHNEALYNRVFKQGTLGAGESYMDGWWDADRLDEFFYRVFASNIDREFAFNWRLIPYFAQAILFNRQSKSKSRKVGEQHYDIGNDLYKAMLDKRMVYTCAYWDKADNLDDAQEAKLDLVCKKLHLKKGMTILDIGCGWGSFAKYAAEKYDVKVLGITISKEQVQLATELCKGLPVEIRLQDYRDVNQKFDRIVSLGMFEHVGSKNHRAFMEVAHRCLKNDGLFLLHTIGSNVSVHSTNPWTDKYIFPNGVLPSIKQIGASIENLFIMEDLHNFGSNYDRTLMEWFKNFDKHWDKLKGKYGERFYRMWKFYLLSSAGGFRSRKLQLWQMVLSKNGIPGGYKSVR
jgi:cyclopropane-fatty-acyl-phospholipid synthase